MGRSDAVLEKYYNALVRPQGETALLGFTNNKWFGGDLYDLQLKNWNINDDWNLEKKYDTIISLRCPYFAKDPEAFIERCHNHLNDDGKVYLEWGFGDHWRFENYKIGWFKDAEHEYAYGPDNYLWSGVWDDTFLSDSHFKAFEERVKRRFGYSDVKGAIYQETPKVLELNAFKKYFNLSYNILTLWEDMPQLYILVHGVKK